MAKKKRQFAVRFAVARNGKIASAIWRVWKGSNNDNIYIAVRSLAGIAKATLHANRYCHFAFTSQSWSPGAFGASKRALVNWTRGVVENNDARGVVAVFIPARYLAETDQVIDADTYVIDAPGRESAVIVECIYARYAYRQMPKPPGGIELGYVKLSDDEYFVVFAGIVPFDVGEFERTAKLDRPLSLNSANQDLLNANRMLVINDPVKDGMLKLIDVGGIKVTQASM